MPSLDLYVVVLNYNTRDLLRACLDSLRRQTGLAFEACVTDNASSDESADMVAGLFPEVRLVRSPSNAGFSAGNNLGLSAAGWPENGNARYAMLLNPDTVVPDGALAAMVAYADAHPDVGVVGPRLMLPDGTLDKACRRGFPTPEAAFYRFSGLSRLFPRSPRFGRYNMTFAPEDQELEVDSVVGACMLVRAEALARVGLMDERFFMYGEDLDWCLRIKQLGYRVMYVPSVIVHHVKRAASRRSAKAHYEFQRAMWLFYQKHYAANTNWALDKLVKLGLMARGGKRLASEIMGSRN
jgi:GT2 family glycosyltransferase